MKALRILKLMFIGLIFITVLGWIVTLLWNWLVPELFGGPAISFWQALGLFALAKILFAGFGSRHRWHSAPHWKHRFYQKFSSMTPDEREAFKARMKEKWCMPKKPAP